MTQNHIPKIFWLWIPIIFVIGQCVLEVVLPRGMMNASLSENGPHEILQFLIIASAAFVPIFYFISRKTDKNILYKIWFALAFICCVYVAGEEVSWGQHFFNWGTPESWQAVNDQAETNLHNTSSWLDQKPRLILMIGIVFGTLVAPILISNIGTHGLDKILNALDINFFARYSEVQEILLFYFVLLYLINLYHRLSYTETP